jgi:drug/metabolite transporter (DMT)-like permease
VILIAGLIAWRNELLPWRTTWRAGVMAGVLFAVEFFFVAEGLRHTTASRMAVFLYTAPIFTAVGLHRLLPAERLKRHQWLGILVAFAGIAVAFLGGDTQGATAPASLWGDFLGVLAGAAWGATIVLIRASSLSEAPPLQTLLYQLAGAFVLLLGAAAVLGQSGHVSTNATALWSILFQGVIVSFASFLTWFSLLRRYVATGLSVFSFMTPIFGVTFGVLVLGDPLSLSFVAGAALVLAGITIVSGAGIVRRRGAASQRTPEKPTAPAEP